MKIKSKNVTIVVKEITLETNLERAVFKAMANLVKKSMENGEEFDEEVRIELDKLTGMKNVYAETDEIFDIMEELKIQLI